MRPTPMLAPDRTPEGWGQIADSYDAYLAPFFSEYATDALDRTRLRAGERVLDVACGSGALALQAARRGAQVLATDFSADMVAQLRRRAESEGVAVQAEVMDGQALDLPDGSFDAAYSNFGLMFFPDRAAGFRELRRVLRPGGRAGVVVWAAPERSETFTAFFTALEEAVPDLPEPDEPPAVFSLADPQRLASEMAAGGFGDVEVEAVQHTWRLPDVDTAWTAFTTTNPVVPELMAGLDAATATRLRDVYLAGMRERFGTGPVALRAEAIVATGQA